MAVLTVALAVAGCGMAYPDQVEGGVGVGVGDHGQPVVHFLSCGSPVVGVIVLQGREGLDDDEENPIVGEWVIDPPATQGFLDLESARPTDYLGLEKGQTYLVEVLVQQEDARLAGTEVELGEIEALGPDQVLTADGRVVAPDELADCAGR
jgi:hypothetical protein